jgi:sodium/bile acid cotransporter 7
MSFPLDAGSLWSALRRPTAALLGITVNSFLLPLLAWALSFLLPPALSLGLLVAATIPCTLASAAVWTRRAGGNDAVAMVVMMVTNLTCFLVTPAWLAWLWISSGASLESDRLNFAAMTTQLAVVVVIPILVGQIARTFQPAGNWATRNKLSLGVLAQFGILSMVFLGSIHCGLQLDSHAGSTSIPWDEWAMMLLIVVFIHVSMLTLGYALGKATKLAEPERIAVGFSGSQKTLMVGLHVGIDLNAAILPVVAYHVSQLLIDTVVADWIRARKHLPPRGTKQSQAQLEGGD